MLKSNDKEHQNRFVLLRCLMTMCMTPIRSYMIFDLINRCLYIFKDEDMFKFSGVDFYQLYDHDQVEQEADVILINMRIKWDPSRRLRRKCTTYALSDKPELKQHSSGDILADSEIDEEHFEFQGKGKWLQT